MAGNGRVPADYSGTQLRALAALAAPNRVSLARPAAAASADILRRALPAGGAAPAKAV